MEDIKQLSTASETAQTSVVGATSFTAYPLAPVQFLKEIVEAGKKRMFFEQVLYRTVAPQGTKDVVIPVKSTYFGYNGTVGMRVDTTERTAADITWTQLDNLDGVTLTPAIQLSGVALTNHALRTNSLDLLNVAREELIYAISDKVDQDIVTALVASTVQSTSTARGAQIVYGGDARRDSELAAGDTLTTDMIAEARRKLMSATCKYWPDSAGSEADSSAAKNPWYSTPEEPFVLFLAPEQEEVLLTDSQFVNAAEYGNNDIVLNGEIGKYLGIKVVVAHNVKAAASGAAVLDYSSTTTSVAMHRCMMVKSRKCGAIAYGMEPKLTVFDYPNRAQQRIALESAYQAKVLYKDAIVFLDVADA